MAVYFRLEKDNNDSVSFVMEDTDGSGDLNRILGKLANKHVAEGTTNQPLSEACVEIMQAMVEESEVILGKLTNINNILVNPNTNQHRNHRL